MKIQVTRTKSIDINFGSRAGKSKSGPTYSDIVGVELFSQDARGCPAVRLVYKKGAWHCVAADFVPAPEGLLPDKWESSSHQVHWSLPAEFQAPYAALTVSSPDGFVRQRSELPEHIGIAEATDGVRHVSIAMADESSALECGLPEYQLLWLSRLLPEGRRPTACSVQLLTASILSAIKLQPDFISEDGNALVLYVGRDAVWFFGYKEGELILFRQCPDVGGYLSIREYVKKDLGLEDSIVDSVLDDSLIDLRPVLESFVRPVLNQTELSLTYLASRHSLKVKKVFLMGLPSGAHYWNDFASEILHMPLVMPSAFNGIKLTSALEKLTTEASQSFVGALGAALAAVEEI